MVISYVIGSFSWSLKEFNTSNTTLFTYREINHKTGNWPLIKSNLNIKNTRMLVPINYFNDSKIRLKTLILLTNNTTQLNESKARI